MNNDATYDATSQPVTLDNEYNPDTTIFSVAAPADTSTTASVIVHDDPFL